MAHTLDHYAELDCHCRRSAPWERQDALRWFGISLGGMRLYNQRRRQRLALLDLDNHQLTDIGITRESAEHEAAKYFWA